MADIWRDRATVGEGSDHAELAEAYLHVLKRLLTGGSYRTPEPRRRSLGWLLYKPARDLLRRRGLEVVKRVDPDERDEGFDYSSDADTMVGLKRLDNLHHCIARILLHDVPGDFIETGVWRGGASIFMRAALRAYGDLGRVVWVADSFEGLPRPNRERYPADTKANLWKMEGLCISLESVRANFAKYGLLDDQVRFLPGWFSETLPGAPIERLSLLRLDGDMYESTIDALSALYDKVSVGGYVIVDDYALSSCREAVDTFRKQRAIVDELHAIDWTGVYWQRSA